MKFGGAVLSSPDGFRQMLGILASVKEPTVVVVSALSTATRDLEFAARLAKKGLLEESLERLDQMIDDHKTQVRQLLPDPEVRAGMESLISEVRGSVAGLLEGVSITAQLTPRTLDQILSYGEFMALHIAKHVVGSAGIDVGWIDSRNLIVTNDVFGGATPLPDKSSVMVEKSLRPLLEKHQIVLTQGFVGATADGLTTTMGRESSNLTATLIGSLTDAESITIWTDVEGIRSGDPHICRETRVRDRISYADATVGAQHGVKLLYRTMIEPAALAGIPIHIRCASKPQGESTTIEPTTQQCEPIVALQESDNGTSFVNTLFVHPSLWLQVVSSVLHQFNEDDIVSVYASAQEKWCRVECTNAAAQALTSSLHSSLFKMITQSKKEIGTEV